MALLIGRIIIWCNSQQHTTITNHSYRELCNLEGKTLATTLYMSREINISSTYLTGFRSVLPQKGTNQCEICENRGQCI